MPIAKNTKRFQMTMPAWLEAAAMKRAEEKGISFSEYVKDLIKDDVKRETH